MKDKLIHIAYNFFKLLFFPIYILKLINILRKIKSVIFSSIISKEFKSCGENLSIFLPFYVVGEKYINIGDNFNCFKGLRIEAHEYHQGVSFSPQINIGNSVSMNFDCHIACVNKIIIGDNVLIASRVFITDHFHGEINSSINNLEPSNRRLVSKGPVTIEESTWIGEGVVIMPNVKIGKFSIIGANSVVTKSFPPYSIIGGNPAKLIKSIK